MGILADWQIEAARVAEPLEPCADRPGVISYGLTSYGLDARVGYKFKVFSPVGCQVIDPKAFDPKMLVGVDLTQDAPHAIDKAAGHGGYYCPMCFATLVKGGDIHGPCPKGKPDHVLISPNSFALAETVETFTIPRGVIGVVVGKSTLARCGLIVNCTPLEPEWTGKLTVELSNTAPLPMKVYAGEGIMQVLFFRADEVCRSSYKDKKGRYQAQAGLTLPFVGRPPEGE